MWIPGAISALIAIPAALHASEVSAQTTPQQTLLTLQKEALVVLQNFAAEMCQKPPLESTTTKLTVAGEAKVSGILLRVAGLQGGAAASYVAENSIGIKPEHVAEALKDTGTCRINIVEMFKRIVPDKIEVVNVEASSIPWKPVTEEGRFKVQDCAYRIDIFGPIDVNGNSTYSNKRGEPLCVEPAGGSSLGGDTVRIQIKKNQGSWDQLIVRWHKKYIVESVWPQGPRPPSIAGAMVYERCGPNEPPNPSYSPKLA